MSDTVQAQVVRVVALGRAVDIELPNAIRPTRILQQWSRCLVGDDDQVGQAEPVRYPADCDLAMAEYSVATNVTLSLIQARAGELTMLHAAGVADLDTGAVTALVAESGTGKTTAGSRLCTTDFGYVTDETVAVLPDRSVLPYPKPLSIITEGQIHKQQHGPEELGLLHAPDNLRLTRIVVLKRDRNPGDLPQVEPVALLDGILALIPQLSYLTRMPQPLLSLVRLIQECGGISRLSYCDIDQCADALRSVAADVRTEDADVEHLVAMASAPPEPVAVGTVRRRPYLDGVRIDDELLLLIENRPIRCSGLGATVWLALDVPRTPEELVGVCVRSHGDHPQAADLVHAAIRELAEHDVLELG